MMYFNRIWVIHELKGVEELKIPLQEKYILSATEPCLQPTSVEVVTQDPNGE